MKEFGLSKKEILRSKNEFELIYTKGSFIISKSQILKAVFFFDKSLEEKIVRVAFAVHKKSGNAVWRNRFKRLLRESYRFNKNRLNFNNGLLLLVLSNNSLNSKTSKHLKLENIVNEVIDLIEKINTRV